MNKCSPNRLIRLALPVVFLALVVSVGKADDHKPHAEILHWWSTDGESAALKVIIDAFESRGGIYYDSSKDNQVANRQEAISRMGKGYPASLTQWNAGNDLAELYDYGLIKPIDDSTIVHKLKTTLPASILDTVTYKGKVIALPLNVHVENWLWYSYKHINQPDVKLSGNWLEFLELGEALSHNEVPLLAVGNQSWQVRILFTSVFLGVSRDRFKDFYLTGDEDVVDSHEFRTVLSVFNRLARYSHSFGDGSWDSQVKAVAENRAAGVFMGDWAKGEFITHGMQSGEDYGCRLTSTDEPSLLVVIDTLVLGKLDEKSARDGQKLMLDVVSDANVSLDFNALKGSVSPYAKPAPSAMDTCDKQVYAAIDDEEAIIPPYHSYFSNVGEQIEYVDMVIDEFWNASRQSNQNPAELIEHAVEKFRSIIEHRED